MSLFMKRKFWKIRAKVCIFNVKIDKIPFKRGKVTFI